MIYLYGCKFREMIFPTQPSWQKYDVVWGWNVFRKLGCWTEKKSHPGFSKSKIDFSPKYFLIHFKVILGVKAIPK